MHTDYGGRNVSLADQLRDAIESSPIIVALTDEYAQSRGLEKSARFPWDDSKGIYHVKAFHHLHCLVSQVSSLSMEMHVDISPTEVHAQSLYRRIVR